MNEIIKVYQEVHEQLDKSINNVFLQLFNFYDQKQKERIEQSKKFVQDRKKTKSLMKEAKQYENDNDIEKAIKSYLQAADLAFAIFESGGPADPDSLLTAGLRLYELELPEYAELCMNKLLTMMNTFDKVDEKLKLMVHKVLDLIHSTKQKTDKNT